MDGPNHMNCDGSILHNKTQNEMINEFYTTGTKAKTLVGYNNK